MEKYLPLKDFTSSGRALVFLIWEREFGAPIDKMQLVCIHSSEELAQRRIEALNSRRFWNKDDLNLPKSYSYEPAVIDHLFAAKELGYDFEKDKIESQVLTYLLTDSVQEKKYNNLLNRSKEKIESLEAEIKRLKGE